VPRIIRIIQLFCAPEVFVPGAGIRRCCVWVWGGWAGRHWTNSACAVAMDVRYFHRAVASRVLARSPVGGACCIPMRSAGRGVGAGLGRCHEYLVVRAAALALPNLPHLAGNGKGDINFILCPCIDIHTHIHINPLRLETGRE